MLTLLGLRKKKLQQIVVAEYGLGWLLSVLVGLLFGNLIYFSFQELLYHISADMIQKSVVGAKPYFYTVFMGLILVLLVVMITLTMMEGKDLDSFAAGKETREFKLESWKWVFLPVIGIGLFIAGDYASYKSGKGMIVAQIFWIVSAVLIFYVGISLALEFLKTRKKFYMKNLLRLNQLYHHFTSNFLIIFMLFLIHFFAAGYVAYGVGSCLPIYADPTMYPYDFVWSAKVDIRREQIGFVFQDFYLMDSLSVEENIMLPMILGQEKVAVMTQAAQKYAEQFQISHLLKKNPYELSGGEKQRVAICRALINDPDLILADEPTGNLDSKSGQIVIDALVRINQEFGKTIVMVTHDPQMASYCSRIILLKDGVILDNLNHGDSNEEFYQEIIGRMADL